MIPAERDAYAAKRVSQGELAAALATIGYPPQRFIGAPSGGSGHYRVDYAAHARVAFEAVAVARRNRPRGPTGLPHPRGPRTASR